MAFSAKILLLLLGICVECLWHIHGATLSPVLSSHQTEHTLQNLQYLPPYRATNYGDKTLNTIALLPKQSNHAVATNSNIDFFQTRPQLSGRVTASSSARLSINKQQPPAPKIYSSYAPPASGAAPFQYSMPQASNQVPLPALLPKSIVVPLATSTAPLQQQRYNDIGSSSSNNVIEPELSIANAPLLMVEAPAATILTPNHNRTLQAARILASTLLEASGEAPLAPPLTAGPNTEQLNSTDVLIVRSQKNAYIIPAQLAKDVRNPSKAHALYQMRDQLEKAYTINQFIFIIKPERINFLNKLV